MYQRIILTTNGSPTSERALLEVARMADAGAAVCVLTVVNNPLISCPETCVYLHDCKDLLNKIEEQGEKLLTSASENLERLGVHPEKRLVELRDSHHSIAEAIHAAAEEWGADVIVIGAHDCCNWFERMRTENIPDQLVRKFRLPVLIVHGPDKAKLHVN